ncbi:MAG: S1 RNA-binding domain-containing protein [Candidatus Woesearchaeota archaeon]
MIYQKPGSPSEGEIVLCTVTKIMSHSVFVVLNQYGNRSAILHISEVSPGRIRNLRDYVKEGKQIICKVLSYNERRGHIDVSLRRVGESLRMQFSNHIKQEQSVEKLLELFCKEQKLDMKAVITQMHEAIAKDYEFIYQACREYVQGIYDLKKSGLSPAKHKLFLELVKSRIKPPKVEIVAKLKLISFAGDGLFKVREAVTQAMNSDTKNLHVTYGGGGNYVFRIVTEDFKHAQKILQQAIQPIRETYEDAKNAVFEFTQQEGRQIQ